MFYQSIKLFFTWKKGFLLRHSLNVVHSEQYWGQLVRLANETGSRLLYDLNLQQRDGVQWGPENTLELLQFTVDQGLAGLVDFELGNGK